MAKVLNKRTDNIPPDAIYVGRPTKWGNPMTVKEIMQLFPMDTKKDSHVKAVEWYKQYLQLKPDLIKNIGELRGRDLVCWCAPLPCHADILLQIANEHRDA